MPKQTFLNLHEEKRQKIIDIAIKEFALNNYTNASLSQIVEKAGIAKGSMYQYFESKKDLYFFLISFISEKKLSFINANLKSLQGKATDFFALFKDIIFLAAQFDMKYPTMSRMLYLSGHESYNAEIGDMSKKILAQSTEYMESFIKQAQKEGQLRGDLSPAFMAFIISYLSVDIGDYIEKKFNFSYEDAIKQGKGELPVSYEELDKVLTDLCSVLKNGLSPS